MTPAGFTGILLEGFMNNALILFIFNEKLSILIYFFVLIPAINNNFPPLLQL